MTLEANAKGALWIVASCVAATIMSLGMKFLAGEIHSTQIVLIRCLVGIAIITPSLIKSNFKLLKTSQLKLHIIRGLFAAVAINMGFYSLTVLPLATVTVLFFTAPLFVTLFAIPILKEVVGWRRLAATFVGFLGTIIVLNPGLESFDTRLLIPMISSVFFAISLILNKQLSKSDPPAVLMFYIFFITAIMTFPFAYTHLQTPNLNQWLVLIAVVSLFATFRTYFDIRGYSIGEASYIAPFQYLRILFIGIGAYYLYAEIPQLNVLAGAGVIILSTLYIAQREFRLKRT